MAKYRSLVKDIETFEKIALYGTKSSFLNKLAQDASSPTESFYMSPEERRKLGLPPTPPPAQAPPIQDNSVPDYLITPESNGNSVLQTPQERKQVEKQYNKFTPIPTSIQQSLNFLAGEAHAPLPKNNKGYYVSPDGKLGTETRKALDWFATANGLVGKPDKELFAAIAEKQRQYIANQTKQQSPVGPTPGETGGVPVESSNIKAPMSRV